MEVKELDIHRTASYETPANILRGTVTLEGPGGRQTVVLSNRSVSQIFEIVRNDVVEQSKLNSKQVDKAMQNAADEPLLIEQAKVPEIGNDN